jgi:hypothetical protein
MHEVDDKFVQNFNRQGEWKRPLERRRRKLKIKIKSVALQALTNLGRLSSRR